MDSTGRDRGLSRIARLTRWSAAGALGMTGAFSVLVARTHPGTNRATAPPSTSGPAATAPSDDAADNGGTQLQPPAQPPATGRGSGAVTSGAS